MAVTTDWLTLGVLMLFKSTLFDSGKLTPQKHSDTFSCGQNEEHFKEKFAYALYVLYYIW